MISLILNYGLDWPQGSHCEISQEIFVVFYSSIDKITNYIAEESCIGLAKLFNIKLITVEGLYLFIVFLSNYFAKFMQEDIFGLTNRLRLQCHKLSDRQTLVSTFREI